MNTLSMARKKKDLNPNQQLARAILEQYQPKSVEDMQDALKDIFGPMFEAMLQRAMDSHLGYEANDHSCKHTENGRNGYSHENVKTTYGEIPAEVSRDCEFTFELQVIFEHTCDYSGIEDKVLAICGMHGA